MAICNPNLSRLQQGGVDVAICNPYLSRLQQGGVDVGICNWSKILDVKFLFSVVGFPQVLVAKHNLGPAAHKKPQPGPYP